MNNVSSFKSYMPFILSAWQILILDPKYDNQHLWMCSRVCVSLIFAFLKPLSQCTPISAPTISVTLFVNVHHFLDVSFTANVNIVHMLYVPKCCLTHLFSTWFICSQSDFNCKCCDNIYIFSFLTPQCS